MSFVWTRTPPDAFAEYSREYARLVRAGVYAIAQRYAAEIEAWMKTNAPWTDRTGNARQTLYTEVERLTESMTEILLSHGVDYGIFLELANAGRYAVIGPALDIFAPRIWQDVVRLMQGTR